MRERATGAELMDDPAADRAELARSLADLQGVNRWLGGTRVVLHHVGGMLKRLPPGRRRVLDVATGSADIPIAVARWARDHKLDVEIVATDAHAGTLALARAHTASHPSVRVEAADALDLPFADGEFDLAFCATALHHFDAADAVRVLRELDRVARYGIVVSDPRRSRLALVGARLLAATLWRNNRFTRHDGPLSVRRAFTPAELRELAGTAGLRNARVFRHPIFRLALVVDRTRGGAKK